MFKSKRRRLAVPQSEHLKLVGALAYHWGNGDFDLPEVERAALVAGIGWHDRGYGYLDDAVVLEMPEARWLEITRRGFDMTGSDAVADMIARYHLRRLTANNPSPAARALYADFSRAIEAQLDEHGLSTALFERIDRITDLCDSISFSFCFEEPADGRIAVFPRNGQDLEVEVRYTVSQAGFCVSPGPFGVSPITGYITGYRLPEYPARLDPVILPYFVSPGA